MKNLTPTLWRTCRMLAGQTRIQLLRQLHDTPDQNIRVRADALGISQPFASQEMRRIQSRGLLQASRRGASVVHVPKADPQVASAAPLLKAVWTAFDTFPIERDIDMTVIAAGLGHQRRMDMVRTLMQGPQTAAQLLAAHPMAPTSFYLHLRTLIASGFVQTQDRTLVFKIPPHPLAKALVTLLRQDATK